MCIRDRPQPSLPARARAPRASRRGGRASPTCASARAAPTGPAPASARAAAAAARSASSLITDPSKIIGEARKNLYEGAPEEEIKEALILSSRSLVEIEPNYTFATARILLDSLRTEALSFLEVKDNATFDEMKGLYGTSLKAFVEKAISLELLDPELQNMDLDFLGNQIKPERDLLFSYLGLQTLYDRYFIHSDEIRFELPQVFFMRVSMGLALNEENKEEKAIEFYKLLSSFDYMSSTPTLFNSGTLHSQLSSCYLTTVSYTHLTLPTKA